MFLLASLTWSQFALGTLLILLCALLMIVILLQRGRGGGLASAFGGGGGGGAFGAKTGDVFTLITVILASVFLVTAVLGVYVFTPQAIALPPPPQVAPTTDATSGDDAALPAPTSAPAGDAAKPAETSATTPADSTAPATTPAANPEPAPATSGTDQATENNAGADDL